MNPLLPLLDSPVVQFLAQQGDSASDARQAGALFGSLLVLLLVLAFAVAAHFFMSYCMKRICEKCGHEPGILIWIPIANLIPQLTAAKLPTWMIILFFIPLVNLAAFVMLFWKLCEARGKAGPLGLLMLVPVANLGLVLYLAFAD
ncbi:MAG: hypothetical protein FJ392_09715 [Verrucomicrobia bacterium]|nr:hypothetical protein [Verrucomicrobiota bacterium]